jgi:hypothetical protein
VSARDVLAPAKWGRALWRANSPDDLSGHARTVARVLADHADDRTGECRLRVSTMVSETGLSDRSIRRALKQLEAGEHLVQRHTRGASFYGLRGGPYQRPDDPWGLAARRRGAGTDGGVPLRP